MQSTLRALTKNGGAVTKVTPTRGLHTSPVSTIIKAGLCRDGSVHSVSKGDIINHDINSRNISTAITSKLRSTEINPSRNLGPRAKAGFNTSIVRKDLGFLPFESSIIFPNLDLHVRVSEYPDIRVPFLPENVNPTRVPEPEYKVTRPIISTVSDTMTHIAAPSAIMEGINVSFMFGQEEQPALVEEENRMLRAFKGIVSRCAPQKTFKFQKALIVHVQ